MLIMLQLVQKIWIALKQRNLRSLPHSQRATKYQRKLFTQLTSAMNQIDKKKWFAALDVLSLLYYHCMLFWSPVSYSILQNYTSLMLLHFWWVLFVLHSHLFAERYDNNRRAQLVLVYVIHSYLPLSRLFDYNSSVWLNFTNYLCAHNLLLSMIFTFYHMIRSFSMGFNTKIRRLIRGFSSSDMNNYKFIWIPTTWRIHFPNRQWQKRFTVITDLNSTELNLYFIQSCLFIELTCKEGRKRTQSLVLRSLVLLSHKNWRSRLSDKLKKMGCHKMEIYKKKKSVFCWWSKRWI